MNDAGQVLVRVSFLIISYNQESFIEEAIVSALSQDYPEMQIVVSDDCSSDHTWAVIQKIAAEYSGRHQLVINQAVKNRGLAENFNHGLGLCSGELIVVQAGDDISESDRVSKLVQLWLRNNCKPDLLYSNISWMDARGTVYKTDRHQHNIPDLKEIKKGRFYVAGGMACAYTSRLFEKFGPLLPNIRTEDYVLTYRAILAGGIAFEQSALLRYRQHDKSEMHMRRDVNNYELERKNVASALAEAKDRLMSWRLSGLLDPLYGFKLNRAYAGVFIGYQAYFGGFFLRMLCALLALLIAKPLLSLRIVSKKSFIR